jgi:hypothetical protein
MIAAGLLSAVWLMAGVGFLFISQAPSDCHESDRILCLSAGEFGSYLQGLFAPVAFIWLVAAVWIQSKELGHQREELRLTRTEFEYNREVMKSQAEEARKQAEHIGEQTKVLLTAEADKHLSTHLALLQQWVITHCGPRSEKTGPTNSSLAPGYLTEHTPQAPQEFFVELVRRLLSAAVEYKEGKTQKLEALLAVDVRCIYYICDRLLVIAKLQGKLSASMSTLLQASQVSWVNWELVNLLPKLPEEEQARFPHVFGSKD